MAPMARPITRPQTTAIKALRLPKRDRLRKKETTTTMALLR